MAEKTRLVAMVYERNCVRFKLTKQLDNTAVLHS
jgi:hypothetical protein